MSSSPMDQPIAGVHAGRLSLRAASQKHGVSYSTLSSRIRGVPTKPEFELSKRRFSPYQESLICKWILEEEKSPREAPNSRQVAAFATSLLKHGGQNVSLGVRWVDQFPMSNPSVKYKVLRLKAQRSSSTDTDTDTEASFAVDDGDEDADVDVTHSEPNQQPLPTLPRTPSRGPSPRIDLIKTPQKGQDLLDWLPNAEVSEDHDDDDDNDDSGFKTPQKGQDILDWIYNRQLSSSPRSDCIFRIIFIKAAKALDAKNAEIAALNRQIEYLKAELALAQAQEEEED